MPVSCYSPLLVKKEEARNKLKAGRKTTRTFQTRCKEERIDR